MLLYVNMLEQFNFEPGEAYSVQKLKEIGINPNNINKKTTMLDLGCGNGSFLQSLITEGIVNNKNVKGVDIYPLNRSLLYNRNIHHKKEIMKLYLEQYNFQMVLPIIVSLLKLKIQQKKIKKMFNVDQKFNRIIPNENFEQLDFYKTDIKGSFNIITMFYALYAPDIKNGNFFGLVKKLEKNNLEKDGEIRITVPRVQGVHKNDWTKLDKEWNNADLKQKLSGLNWKLERLKTRDDYYVLIIKKNN